MKQFNARLVDSPNLKIGNIVVVCDDNDVIMIEEVCPGNIEMLNKLPETSIGCDDLYFVNFTRKAFMNFIKNSIEGVK